jgi:prophage regulatory protein
MRRLLDYDGLADKGIKYSRAHIWRLIKAGRFPKPVKIGDRNSWLESEIDDLIEKLIAKRDGKEPANG